MKQHTISAHNLDTIKFWHDNVDETLYALEADPEAALHAACEKFIRRFARVEESAGEQALTGLSEAELSALWQRAKSETTKEKDAT